MSALCDACLRGDFATGREIHRRYHALMEVNFVESNPGPVKAALSMMGADPAVLQAPDDVA